LPYIGTIFPLENIGVKGLTISAILFHTCVNYFGVVFGGRFAAFFTTLKILIISSIVGFAFAYGSGALANLTTDLPTFSMSSPLLIGGVITAFSAAFWAYDGWNNITYIAGEVIQPQRNIPRGLMIGTLVTITVYIIINIAYSYVLPITDMASSSLVAADVANNSMGAMGGAFIAAAVMLSTFGTSNGSIMASSRVFYAMAEDGLFFKSIKKIQPRYHTPANALLLQAVWASVLVMSGTFDLLTDMLIFVSWIFYALGAYGVIVLRRKYPDRERQYKVIGYPIVPLIFVGFATLFVFLTLYFDIQNYAEGKTDIIYSVFGLLLVATGIPFYWFFRKRGSDNAQVGIENE
jgi:APA family basic amino acid/polyamine antiporter